MNQIRITQILKLSNVWSSSVGDTLRPLCCETVNKILYDAMMVVMVARRTWNILQNKNHGFEREKKKKKDSFENKRHLYRVIRVKKKMA